MFCIPNLTTIGFGLSAALLAVVVFGYNHYSSKVESLNSEIATYKAANEKNLKTIDNLKNDLNTFNEIITNQQKQNEILKQESVEEKKKFEEILVHDEKAKNWSDTPIPDAVIKQLYNSSKRN